MKLNNNKKNISNIYVYISLLIKKLLVAMHIDKNNKSKNHNNTQKKTESDSNINGRFWFSNRAIIVSSNNSALIYIVLLVFC